jgi:hypothetical protein
MKTISYAATRFGYCVQVTDGGEVVYEYTAGNCRSESQAVINPGSSGAVSRSHLRRWARQTAKETAEEWRIPAKEVVYAPDLEAQLEPCRTVR